MAKKQNLFLPILGAAIGVGGLVYLFSDNAEAKPTKRVAPTPMPAPRPGPSPKPKPGGGDSGYPGISRNEMKVYQTQLQRNGYNPGTIDGLYGPNTKSAFVAFQQDMGMPPHGNPDPDTLLILAEVDSQHPDKQGPDFPGDPALVDALAFDTGEWETTLAQGQLARIELPEGSLQAGESYSWQVMDPGFLDVFAHEIGGTLYLDIFPTAEVSGQGTIVITVLDAENQPVFEEDMIILVNLM